MGKLADWRVVVLLVVLVGVSVLTFFTRGRPRIVASGMWDIDANHVMYEQITILKPTKLRAEFTPLEDNAEPYAAFVLDEAGKLKFQAPATDPETVQKLATVQGTGPLQLGEVTLIAGTYYVVVENRGKNAMKVKYVLYEIPAD